MNVFMVNYSVLFINLGSEKSVLTKIQFINVEYTITWSLLSKPFINVGVCTLCN